MPNDWNDRIIEEFRANHGHVGGQFQGAPLLLLHTLGAKSGEGRIHPVMYLDQGGRLMVFASFGGQPMHPAWFHNLKANPSVTVELGDEKFAATATEITGPERDQIYSEQAEKYPGFADYQRKTTRIIPVVALTRASG